MRLSITKTYNLLACMGYYSSQIKNGQTRCKSWGKLMTEFQFYNWNQEQKTKRNRDMNLER